MIKTQVEGWNEDSSRRQILVLGRRERTKTKLAFFEKDFKSLISTLILLKLNLTSLL